VTAANGIAARIIARTIARLIRVFPFIFLSP
jgi:hypothetical protein